MAKYFSRPDDDAVYQELEYLIEQHHERLKEIKIDLVMVEETTSGRPALMLHGWPAAALTRATSALERAMGRGDAEIQIAKVRWCSMTERQRRALLDHELQHIQLKKDQLDCVLLDINGRPMVTMRQHDVQVGWFLEVAQRWGEDSIEQQQSREIFEQHKQELFPFLANISPRARVIRTDRDCTIGLRVIEKAAIA